MILIVGPEKDPMIARVVAILREREANFELVFVSDLPGTVRFSLGISEHGFTGSLRDSEGWELPLQDIQAVYHRMGFSDFERYEEYSDQESQFVNSECIAAFNGWLNSMPGLVINRPVASGTNASKPHQSQLLEKLGFRTPRTLVTNVPEHARKFYEELGGQVIYKSISYQRSIVQKMTPEDLDRLDTLTACPIQLQELVPGTDVRVHVVGPKNLFASRIVSEASDYRYDKEAVVEAVDLPEALAQRCFQAAHSLNMTLAGLDLRLTPDGDACCFEANPSPAFSWYENRTGQPIGQTIVELLEAADSAV